MRGEARSDGGAVGEVEVGVRGHVRGCRGVKGVLGGMLFTSRMG